MLSQNIETAYYWLGTFRYIYFIILLIYSLEYSHTYERHIVKYIDIIFLGISFVYFSFIYTEMFVFYQIWCTSHILWDQFNLGLIEIHYLIT